MHAPLLHFTLVHHGAPALPAQPRVLHFSIESDAPRPPTRAGIDLLVVDARRMTPACLNAAFETARRLRATPGFHHGVLVCDVPHLPVIQNAIRSGLRDIIQEPLSARQLVQLLRAATPGRRTCARQISALAAIVRTVGAVERSSGVAALARREYALVQRSEHLAHMEARLSLERAALEDREQKLRASARRIEREYTALQADTAHLREQAALPTRAPQGTHAPFSASPFVADIQALAAQLNERAHALDIRERMLREMETLLNAQLAVPAHTD